MAFITISSGWSEGPLAVEELRYFQSGSFQHSNSCIVLSWPLHIHSTVKESAIIPCLFLPMILLPSVVLVSIFLVFFSTVCGKMGSILASVFLYSKMSNFLYISVWYAKKSLVFWH